MSDDATALAPLVRIRAAIGRERRPIHRPTQTEGSQRNGEREVRRRNRNFVLALRDRVIRTWKRARLETIAALPRHVNAAWRDRPCARFFQLPVTQQQDSNEIVRQHPDAALPAERQIELNRIASASGVCCLYEWLHRYRRANAFSLSPESKTCVSATGRFTSICVPL